MPNCGFQNCITAGRVKNHFGILLILCRLPILHSNCKITTSNTPSLALHIFLHFHTHLTFTNTYILINPTKQYLTQTHSLFRRSDIMGSLLTTYIRYTDVLKDSTGVFSSNPLRFFILYSNSILYHLDIPSILLSRNTLSQHSTLCILTHSTPFANYKYIIIIIQNLLLLLLNLNKHTFYTYGHILFIVYIPNI